LRSVSTRTWLFVFGTTRTTFSTAGSYSGGME
jgi:hypothetical protein